MHHAIHRLWNGFVRLMPDPPNIYRNKTAFENDSPKKPEFKFKRTAHGRLLFLNIFIIIWRTFSVLLNWPFRALSPFLSLRSKCLQTFTKQSVSSYKRLRGDWHTKLLVCFHLVLVVFVSTAFRKLTHHNDLTRWFIRSLEFLLDSRKYLLHIILKEFCLI